MSKGTWSEGSNWSDSLGGRLSFDSIELEFISSAKSDDLVGDSVGGFSLPLLSLSIAQVHSGRHSVEHKFMLCVCLSSCLSLLRLILESKIRFQNYRIRNLAKSYCEVRKLRHWSP